MVSYTDYSLIQHLIEEFPDFDPERWGSCMTHLEISFLHKNLTLERRIKELENNKEETEKRFKIIEKRLEKMDDLQNPYSFLNM